MLEKECCIVIPENRPPPEEVQVLTSSRPNTRAFRRTWLNKRFVQWFSEHVNSVVSARDTWQLNLFLPNLFFHEMPADFQAFKPVLIAHTLCNAIGRIIVDVDWVSSLVSSNH